MIIAQIIIINAKTAASHKGIVSLVCDIGVTTSGVGSGPGPGPGSGVA